MSEILRVDTTIHPRLPLFHVLPKPDGTTRFPELLLVKPDRTLNEIIQGLLGDGRPFRTGVIAQQIKSSLGPAYQGLMLDYRYKPALALPPGKRRVTSCSPNMLVPEKLLFL